MLKSEEVMDMEDDLRVRVGEQRGRYLARIAAEREAFGKPISTLVIWLRRTEYSKGN